MEGLIEGRIVHYVLHKDDVASITEQRNPIHGQAHGNHVQEGDHVPMMIVKVWPDEFGKDNPGVNGQCLLDGNDQYWVTSAKYDEGKAHRTWHWIEKA